MKTKFKLKRKLKMRTQNMQEKKWNLAKEGKVLRQYKKKWYIDPIINNINDASVHIIKRMRIGNSLLRSHYGLGRSKICTDCGDNVPETNEHYLLKCSKYNIQRSDFMKSG